MMMTMIHPVSSVFKFLVTLAPFAKSNEMLCTFLLDPFSLLCVCFTPLAYEEKTKHLAITP